jgi:hypothetical protein
VTFTFQTSYYHHPISSLFNGSEKVEYFYLSGAGHFDKVYGECVIFSGNTERIFCVSNTIMAAERYDTWLIVVCSHFALSPWGYTLQ